MLKKRKYNKILSIFKPRLRNSILKCRKYHRKIKRRLLGNVFLEELPTKKKEQPQEKQPQEK
jgi:hypothetical protein